MTTGHDTGAIAEALWTARRSSGTTVPPSERATFFTLEDGYEVAAVLHERRIAAGERRAGIKIGFTNTDVWTSLGLANPICAPLYDDSVREGAREIDSSGLVAPRIEPEIVVGIAEDGIAWWALGFEIVQCHYPDWHLTPADAIADYGLHALLVVGERRPMRDSRPLAIPAFEVELLCDGEVRERGGTSAVLGGTHEALARAYAITGTLAHLPPPRPGEIVTTGSMTAAPRIVAGETWTLRAAADVPPLSITLR